MRIGSVPERQRQNSFCLLVEAANDCQEPSLAALAGLKSEVQDVLSQIPATWACIVSECQ